MRARRTAVIAVAVICAAGAGPALAAMAGPQAEPAGVTTTHTVTLTTSTFTTPTTTIMTATSTAPKTAPVPKLSVCLKTARAAIARALGVKLPGVRRTQRVGSNGMPQCNYLVHRARSEHPYTRAVVVVNVDNGAQAGWRLMRKNVEADQIFGVPPPGWKPPIGLNGLGPYAAWYPNLDQLMVNNINRRYILTVSVLWYRSKRSEMISLARTAVVPYRQIRKFAR